MTCNILYYYLSCGCCLLLLLSRSACVILFWLFLLAASNARILPSCVVPLKSCIALSLLCVALVFPHVSWRSYVVCLCDVTSYRWHCRCWCCSILCGSLPKWLQHGLVRWQRVAASLGECSFSLFVFFTSFLIASVFFFHGSDTASACAFERPLIAFL